MRNGPPERIVSLAPSNTEILFAIGAGPRVVGVTRYCDYPLAARSVQADVGGFMDVNTQAVIDLKPDLVLAGTTFSDRQRDRIIALRDAGIQVEFIKPKTYLDVIRSIPRIGELTGNKEAADGLASRMLTETNRILAKVHPDGQDSEKVKVYYEEWPGNPTMTVGPGIWIHDMIEMAGGHNVFGYLGGPEPVINPDMVVKADPDVIVLGWCGAGSRTDPRRVRERPGWTDVKAVKEGRIHAVHDTFFTRPGPRLVEGLAHMVDLLSRKGVPP
ncbi:MAG TPA: cobalamin-binding protein [Candidatus Thermoplasmatota archaeon]|nr:cobalamin-binding protein [Candidatus Thermoplasmatota archaeon]